MAFVTVPKDLSKVKTKVALNLTKRQLICFGAAAITGIPVYIFTRGSIGNTAATLLMIAIMLPLFFFAIYERDGMPAEVVLRNIIRTRFAWPGKRPYKTENLYEIMEMEGKDIANSENAAAEKAAAAPVPKHGAAKGKQARHKKHPKN